MCGELARPILDDGFVSGHACRRGEIELDELFGTPTATSAAESRRSKQVGYRSTQRLRHPKPVGGRVFQPTV